MSHLTHSPSPLQAEVHNKREQLTQLRATLADRELDLADLRNRLRTFEARYMAQVGTLYAQLDDLEASIAEAEVSVYKTDAARDRAAAARLRAAETHEAAHGSDTPAETPEPTAALKTLFREVARRLHPDFATDPADAADRTRLMARANEAYTRADTDALQRLLDDHLEEQASDMDTSGSQAEREAAELDRLSRQISHATRDIAALDAELAELPTGDIAQLKTDTDAARLEGRDLLAELAATLATRIADAQHRLAFVTRQVHALDR